MFRVRTLQGIETVTQTSFQKQIFLIFYPPMLGKGKRQSPHAWLFISAQFGPWQKPEKR
jgi:hypothetical protein